MSHEDRANLAARIEEFELELVTPEGCSWLSKEARMDIAAGLRAARPEVAQQYRDALDKAAYALFQLKRFADMPQAAIDFVKVEYEKACELLNLEGIDGSGPQNGRDTNG